MTSSSDATDHPKPVVEPSPATADSTTRALQQRIRQQEILAELGVVALQGKPFLELLSETVRLTAEGMNAEFCKVLEFIPADNRLLVRAGVGWHEGIVGRATVGTYAKSSATWSRRSRLPKSSLMLPKPFVLRRIVRFLLGSSSMSLSRMRGSMLTQIVPGGSIWVRVETENESVAISVRDEGVGLPPSFDPTASKRLGTRLVTALLKQLGGELTRLPTPIGVNFTLHIPLRAAATR